MSDSGDIDWRSKTAGEHAKFYVGMPYQEYLTSEKWSTVRDFVVWRDKGRCLACGGTRAIQVHHRSYRNLYRELEFLRDLACLCEGCHSSHHAGSGRIEEQLAEILGSIPESEVARNPLRTDPGVKIPAGVAAEPRCRICGDSGWIGTTKQVGDRPYDFAERCRCRFPEGE